MRFWRRLLTGGIGQPPWDLPERRPGDRYLLLVAAAEAVNAEAVNAEAVSTGEGDDPGLTSTGRAQAEALAAAVGPLRPMPVVTAPSRRSVETGAPLADRWGIELRREPALAAATPGPILDALSALAADALVVADPEVVRLVVGSAGGDHNEGWRPGPASRTTVRLGPSGLQVLRWGEPADGSSGPGS